MMPIKKFLTGLISKRKKSFGAIFIDCVVEEVHKNRAIVTQFPVEVGVSINEHRILESLELEIEGVISNSEPSIAGSQYRVPDFLNATKETRSTSAYLEIIKLYEKGEPFNVQTGLLSYRNMIITSLDVNRSSRTSDGLFFTAKLKQLTIVNTNSATETQGKLEEGKTKNQGAKNSEGGRVNSNPISPVESETASRWYRNMRAS